MNIDFRYSSHPKDFKLYDTERIRTEFAIEQVMSQDKINLVYSLAERFVAGGIMPVTKPLKLETFDALKSEYFLERRELGIINIGHDGIISVDKNEISIAHREALYVGKGAKEIIFRSLDPSNPSKFYINSTPAHKTYPTKHISSNDGEIVVLGSQDTANFRQINKLLVKSVVETCQLQMGLTQLRNGSIWNTMPPHTHDRRSEVYFYFDVKKDNVICHFMGQPQETRHVWLKNEQAVISPAWSIHAGAGTCDYSFIWGMAGENFDYSDMDQVENIALR
ncbi:MAG TPA: 5-dehydro-4-deoxy-D-glucuronate isomerase [Saprospiraceae bacterium]|jgi:4-deoxy-L-threo-5-hexosulose-uronate ketol-isomerase|nr:5-dehydro-4-deoxy-D-glucuronate isomerase [Saprospiraceae bacterium]HMT52523.1 5-dehydro-4-deoxy-D-glucuronate isomerase [Saprospiraceae bacterium]HMT69396.1 5-dehydro-4-deoxy-D-glucuronate isomerase [Saprospiraceae bacterium]